MSVLVDILTAIMSSGATAAGCTWLAKKSIAHGFAVVLADRRSAFESSLEDKRQTFQRDLEAERRAAEAALERFKSETNSRS